MSVLSRVKHLEESIERVDIQGQLIMNKLDKILLELSGIGDDILDIRSDTVRAVDNLGGEIENRQRQTDLANIRATIRRKKKK